MSEVDENMKRSLSRQRDAPHGAGTFSSESDVAETLTTEQSFSLRLTGRSPSLEFSRSLNEQDSSENEAPSHSGRKSLRIELSSLRSKLAQSHENEKFLQVRFESLKDEHERLKTESDIESHQLREEIDEIRLMYKEANLNIEEHMTRRAEDQEQLHRQSHELIGELSGTHEKEMQEKDAEIKGV